VIFGLFQPVIGRRRKYLLQRGVNLLVGSRDDAPQIGKCAGLVLLQRTIRGF
jgi:hypothetical protein